VYRLRAALDTETSMFPPNLNSMAPPLDEMIEECADEIDEFVATLGRYPEPVLAFAVRMHLSGLLQAMLENGLCTRQQIEEFIRDLAEEVLQPATDTDA
jgi:hypothetical protein